MKNIISEKFVSMASSKSIDKITVKALIEECDISRQTFYYHFKDIMDVIEWSVNKKMEDTLLKSLKAQKPEEAIEIFILSAAQNKDLIQKLLNSQRREHVEMAFMRATRTYLSEMLKKKCPEMQINYSDMEVALDFWACGIAGLMFKYCGRGVEETKILASQICRILLGQIGIFK